MWLDPCCGAELSFVCGLVAVGASLLAHGEEPAMGTVAAPGTPLGRAGVWAASVRGEEMPCPPRTAHMGPAAVGPLTRGELRGWHHPTEPQGPTPLHLPPATAPRVLPTSSSTERDPPRLPTSDGAWGWDQPPFSPLRSTPTSAQRRLGNQPANDARCGADGGPDAILPSSGLSMQMDV